MNAEFLTCFTCTIVIANGPVKHAAWFVCPIGCTASCCLFNTQMFASARKQQQKCSQCRKLSNCYWVIDFGAWFFFSSSFNYFPRKIASFAPKLYCLFLTTMNDDANNLSSFDTKTKSQILAKFCHEHSFCEIRSINYSHLKCDFIHFDGNGSISFGNGFFVEFKRFSYAFNIFCLFFLLYYLLFVYMKSHQSKKHTLVTPHANRTRERIGAKKPCTHTHMQSNIDDHSKLIQYSNTNEIFSRWSTVWRVDRAANYHFWHIASH